MIRSIFFHIIDYKAIHPIRFWVFIIAIIILFSLSTYIINNIVLKKYSNRNTSNQKAKKDDIKNKRSLIPFKKYKTLIGVVTVQAFIIIGLIGLISSYYRTADHEMENPSISSSPYLFGIDISHYQGYINWTEMATSHHPIEYVFIRATMGQDGKDLRFRENWIKAKQHNYIRGAYHYYRPNENSTLQFQNYSEDVNLIDGDFIPILDIEKESLYGMDNLRAGVLNWLQLAEQEYGVKPLVYTGLTFYLDNLKGYIDDYPLWIAAYSGKHRVQGVNWTFHQFTEKAIVKGIKTTVDGNDFNGNLNDLNRLLIRH